MKKSYLQLIATLTIVTFVAALTVSRETWAEEKKDEKGKELPPDPGATPIPEDQAWAYGTTGTEDLEGDEPFEGDVVCVKVGLGAPKLQVSGLVLLPGGILMSEAKALRAADYKIAYTELRGLYSIDLQVWDAKEKVYEDNLKRADKQIEKLDKQLNSKWNRYKFAVGMGIGFGLAVVLAILTVVIIEKVD
jgi:hypothetical protein